MSAFGAAVSHFAENFQFSELSQSKGQAVSSFVDATHSPGGPITPQGHLVSDFIHSFPGDPSLQFGQAVTDFVHELHIPGNPVTPQGQLVSGFIHSYPGDPSLQFGQAVTEFVHELHVPITNFDLLA